VASTTAPEDAPEVSQNGFSYIHDLLDGFGPLPTLRQSGLAAAQFHRSGLSCVAQHFPTADVG